MLHLQSLTVRPWAATLAAQFPFNVPVLAAFPQVTFTAPVTFFVGENGSGKSTLLEAIACAAGAITVGAESVKTDPSLHAVRQLARYLKLAWRQRTHKGFFLRAEDFFGYVKQLAQLRQGLEAEEQTVDREYAGRSALAHTLAKQPYRNELRALQQRYGAEGLDARSHGESFLTLFQARFVPGGLYLLDEPEAPLSPVRQLALLAALKQMVAQNGQFIIATHSPILMAYPGAVILNFAGAELRPVPYDDLEHVQLTKAFLNNPEAYLRHL